MRVTIAPTIGHAMRISHRSVVFEVLVASQAIVSWEARARPLQFLFLNSSETQTPQRRAPRRGHQLPTHQYEEPENWGCCPVDVDEPWRKVRSFFSQT